MGERVISKGLKWVIGNGKQIRVFKDRWIPCPISFMTILPDPRIDIRVADLFDRNRRWWDIDKLNRFLLAGDKEIVLSIPISWSGGEDFLAWHFEKNGKYSVKSRYRLALSQKIYESGSNSDMLQSWWNKLWNLNLPPKVKIFVWRACWNAFPSLQNLWKRKVVESPRCNRCSDPAESLAHAIF